MVIPATWRTVLRSIDAVLHHRGTITLSAYDLIASMFHLLLHLIPEQGGVLFPSLSSRYWAAPMWRAIWDTRRSGGKETGPPKGGAHSPGQGCAKCKLGFPRRPERRKRNRTPERRPPIRPDRDARNFSGADNCFAEMTFAGAEGKSNDAHLPRRAARERDMSCSDDPLGRQINQQRSPATAITGLHDVYSRESGSRVPPTFIPAARAGRGKVRRAAPGR